MRTLIGGVVLLAATLANAQIALQDGVGTQIQLISAQAGQVAVTQNYFIDLPAGTRRVDVSLVDQGSGRDLDLYMKLGQAFPDTLNDTAQFTAFADYYGISAFGDESIVMQDAITALSGQRAYIQVLAFSGASSSATLTAVVSSEPPQAVEFIIDFDNLPGATDCDTAPWYDSSPFVPNNGNDATTLGEARRNAMTEAARLLARELFSPIPVQIDACWDAQGGDDTSAPLAAARPTILATNTPGVAVPDQLHVAAVITRRAGTSVSSATGGDQTGQGEIRITFNSDIGGGEVLPGFDWYYGYSRFGLPSTRFDFISVAMHEISHGLGFINTMNDEGEFLRLRDSNGVPVGEPVPDTFIGQLIDNRNGDAVPLPEASPSERLAAATSGAGLQWAGAEATLDLDNIFALVDDGYTQLHAPDEYDPGGSVGHVSSSFCELMTAVLTDCPSAPHRALGITRPMLHAVGWAPASDRPPYLGLMYDRSRDGHGFEFQLGGQDADGRDVYVLTFYSYENIGSEPEWFQATGMIENGIFSGTRNIDGYGFPRFLYELTRSPPQQADSNARGQVVLNFNDPAGHEACDDGINRGSAEALAVMQWIIGNQIDAWCVEPLISASTRPATDFGGLWFAGVDDTGWGFSLENVARQDGTMDLFVVLFVYAADGTPVWFFGNASGVEVNQSIQMDLVQRTGFRRSQTQGTVQDATAGTLTMILTTPSSDLAAGNRVSVDVTYQGSEGGSWLRDDVAIQRLTLGRE